MQRYLILVVTLLVLAPAVLLAQGADSSRSGEKSAKREKARAEDLDPFWETSIPRAQAAAAAQVVAIGNPIGAVTLRLAGEKHLVWGWEVEEIPERAPLIPDYLLAGIQDQKPFPDLANRPPDEIPKKDWLEYHAYCKALFLCWKVGLKPFQNSAKENDHLTWWGHLYRTPREFRGQVVGIKGILKRLRKFDPPWEARVLGVPYIYEGWVFSEIPGGHPVCVVFADIPDGVQPGEQISHRINSAGYFFKRYRYMTAGQGPRETLFFLAPTFTVDQSSAATGRDAGAVLSLPLMFFLIAAGFIICTMGLLVFLTWFFRRGDKKVEQRLAINRTRAVDLSLLEGDASPEAGTNGADEASNGVNPLPSNPPTSGQEPPDAVREEWPRR